MGMEVGDQTAIAKETARRLKLDESIYNFEILTESSNAAQRKCWMRFYCSQMDSRRSFRNINLR